MKDLPKAIQQFLLEMYIMHNGWGIYYFKDAECVMVEVDNHRLNDVLGREEEEGVGGREVTDLGKFGSVTFFHIALQALGMCTGKYQSTKSNNASQTMNDKDKRNLEASKQR